MNRYDHIGVKLKGGMGNQMFQYAVGRRLALKHECLLKLDLSFLMGKQAGTTPRTYGLGHFRLSENIMTTGEMLPHNYFVYHEKQYHFDPYILSMPANCYLDGFWQSDKYFIGITDLIRNEFSVAAPLSENRSLATEINAVDSVSVHVRRGDYINDRKTNEKHGICDLDYYRRAEHLIEQKVNTPHFYIFSDDPEWVVKSISFRHPVTFVSHNQENAQEDMRLMSFCKHHVIANSSFSWWGAWLGSYPDKIVIAPKRWFRDPTINTDDLIPTGWVRL